jgi:hypothetical protein
VFQNLNSFLRRPDTRIMVAQVGFNDRLEAVTISVVVVLPTGRFLYLVIGMVRKSIKTFYINDRYKCKEEYKCKDPSVQNLNSEQCKILFKL